MKSSSRCLHFSTRHSKAELRLTKKWRKEVARRAGRKKISVLEMAEVANEHACLRLCANYLSMVINNSAHTAHLLLYSVFISNYQDPKFKNMPHFFPIHKLSAGLLECLNTSLSFLLYQVRVTLSLVYISIP